MRTEQDIVDLLTPKASPQVPESIKSNVLTKIERRLALKNFFTMKNRFSRIVASTAAAAAVVALVVVSVKPASVMAAGRVIDRSLAAAGDVRTMVMTIDVRTPAHESFSYINPTDPMVQHTLTVVRGEKPMWRLEKERRGIVFDGTDKYMWIKDVVGHKGGADDRFEEWFSLLVDPEMVLLREKAALLQRGVKYEVEETGNEIVMTAHVKAQGDFSASDYTRNSSIEESTTRRVITFDRSTGLIKRLQIYAVVVGVRVLIVDMKDVRYNVPVDEKALLSLPSGYEWIDATVVPAAGRFAGISVVEAARLIGDAIDAGDMGSVGETFVNYNLARIGQRFEGMKVVSIGKPFRSGTYVGWFVPYKLKSAGGKTVKLKLALRNDNPNRVWLVDGGI